MKLTKKHAEDCEFREIRAGKWNKLTFEEKLDILGSDNCEERKKVILSGANDISL